ncbi:MAG: hypothetical protein ACKVS5_00205 [Parvularculaceae bacterium]
MHLKKHRVALLAAGVIAVASTSAFATTLLQMSFEDLVADASVVVVGEAVSSRVVESAADGLMTITSFKVKDQVVGSAGSTVDVATAGGSFRSGKFRLRESTADTPIFLIGSEHMLFLNAGPQNALAVVGFSQGAAAVFEGKEGRSVVLPGSEGPESVGEAKERVRAEREGADRRADRETAE